MPNFSNTSWFPNYEICPIISPSHCKNDGLSDSIESVFELTGGGGGVWGGGLNPPPSSPVHTIVTPPQPCSSCCVADPPNSFFTIRTLDRVHNTDINLQLPSIVQRFILGGMGLHRLTYYYFQIKFEWEWSYKFVSQSTQKDFFRNIILAKFEFQLKIHLFKDYIGMINVSFVCVSISIIHKQHLAYPMGHGKPQLGFLLIDNTNDII